MQLNFLGLIVVAVGIILLGLGISGNYKSFGASLKNGVLHGKLGGTSEAAPSVRETASGTTRTSGTTFNPPTNTHTLQS